MKREVLLGGGFRLVEGREEQVEVHLGGGFRLIEIEGREEGGSPGWRISAGRRT